MCRSIWKSLRIVMLIGCMGAGADVYAQERLGPYTLDDMVQLALRLNEDVLIAEQEVEKAKGQMTSARSEVLPRFSLNGYYTRNWAVPASTIDGQRFRFGSTNELAGGASLTIPLYQGGRDGAARRSASAFRAFSESNLTKTRQVVAFETQQAFYAVLLADEMINVNESALSRAEAHQSQVAQLHKAGKASDYELLRARVQVANLKPAVSTAYNNQELAVLRLKHVTGLDLGMPLDIDGVLTDALQEQPPTGRDVDAAVQLAIENRPELLAMDHEIDMLEDAVHIQASETRPNVNLVNSYQNQALVDNLNGLSSDQFIQSYSTRLVFHIPIFDGLKTRGGVRQAEADLTSAEYVRQRAIKSVELEVRGAYMRVQEARERLIAYSESVSEAEKGLEIAEVRYRTGLGAQLETLDAQIVLSEARTHYAQGLNDYGVAVAHLRRVIGVVR